MRHQNKLLFNRLQPSHQDSFSSASWEKIIFSVLSEVGGREERLCGWGATLDSTTSQVFLQDLLNKCHKVFFFFFLELQEFVEKRIM